MVLIIDFDGTVLTHDFPELGKDIGAIPVLKKIVANGHKLVLFTMRSDEQNEQTFKNGYKIFEGDFLTQAVNWFKQNDIPLYGVQVNPTQHTWTTSPKAYGQLIIDDAAIFAPLIYNEEFHHRPYIDWVRMETELIRLGVINE